MSIFEVFNYKNTSKIFQFLMVIEFIVPIVWFLILSIKTTTSFIKKGIYIAIACFITVVPIWSFFW